MTIKFKERLRNLLRKFLPKKEKVKPERVVILIDGENLWYGLIKLGGLEITDFKEFKKRLADGKELAKPPTYFRSVDMEEAQQTLKTLGFLAHLENVGYEVKYKPLLKGKESKSEIDPVIAVDICRFATEDDVNNIILVSGDHHFVPAVEFAKEKGKKVIVVSTVDSLSEELKRASDQWVDLKEIIEGITEKSKMEQKREEALEKLNKGKRIGLHNLEELQ